MMDIFAEFLKELGPVGGMGWLLAAVTSGALVREMRERRAEEDALQAKIAELHKINADIRVAAAENRADDLEVLVKNYEATTAELIKLLRSSQRRSRNEAEK